MTKTKQNKPKQNKTKKTDGTLYICLPPTLPILSPLPLSSACSLFFSDPLTEFPCQLSFRFSSVLQISYSNFLPGDRFYFTPSTFSFSLFPPSSSVYYSVTIPPIPPSYQPFEIAVSGPTNIAIVEGFFFISFISFLFFSQFLPPFPPQKPFVGQFNPIIQEEEVLFLKL